MGKHLHHYKSLLDFEKEYSSDFPHVNSFVCSAGTFTYDRIDDEFGGYIWKNGDKELVTTNRIPKVGVYDYAAETGAYDTYNEVGVEITAVGEIEPAKYYEPWVSYTEDEIPSKVSGVIQLPNWDIPGQLTLEYVGPCDFYEGHF